MTKYRSHSCIHLYYYFDKQYIVFYSVSDFEEVLSYYILFHSEIIYLVKGF